MYYKVVFISYVIYVLHIIDISNQVNCDIICFVKMSKLKFNQLLK